MEIILGIAILIILCTHSVFLGIIMLKVTKSTSETTSANQYVMSDDELKDFKEADANAVQNALSALVNLNDFMTGNDGGYNVEEQ